MDPMEIVKILIGGLLLCVTTMAGTIKILSSRQTSKSTDRTDAVLGMEAVADARDATNSKRDQIIMSMGTCMKHPLMEAKIDALGVNLARAQSDLKEDMKEVKGDMLYIRGRIDTFLDLRK